MTEGNARVVVAALPAFVLGLTCSAPAEPAAPAAPTPPVRGTFALVDVNVVPMTSGNLLQHQTVIIRDGRIAVIGPAAATAVDAPTPVIALPANAYVMPGLVDFHVHTFDASERWLFLANGVTTVRNLHGTAQHLRWRDSLAAGLTDGPRLFTSGPILDGDPPARSTNEVVRTAAEARAAVAAHAGRGFDYIKLYDNISQDAYDAIIAEAASRGIGVIGHLPTPVGVSGLFARPAQAEVEHLEEFLPFFNDGRTTEGLDVLTSQLAQRGIAVTPTISVFTSALAQSQDYDALRRRAELTYMNPQTRTDWGWDATGASRNGVPAARDRFGRTATFMRREMLPRLHRAGVLLLAGTDAPIPAIVPGYSLIEELEEYAAAGLDPYSVLRTATVNPATRIPARYTDLVGIGTVVQGAPADLVILASNPLANISALRSRLGVVSRGSWFSAAALAARLDSVAGTYRAR